MQVKLTNDMCIRVVAAVMVVVDALIAVLEWSWRFIALIAVMASFASAIIETRVLVIGSRNMRYGTTDGRWGIVLIIVSAITCVVLFAELMNSESGKDAHDIPEAMLNR